MSLLRIHASLLAPPVQCQWALLAPTLERREGSGPLSQLPRGARRVALVVPAEQVLLACVRLPPSAKRMAGSLLAFAVEDQFVGEPEANHVVWLGRDGEDDVLAVIDQAGLQRWRQALAAVGIEQFELHSEALLLPWQSGEWSVAWDGREGFLRSAALMASSCDLGDSISPPLVLRLMLEQAQLEGSRPDMLVLYPASADALPDLALWSQELAIDIRNAGPWDWRSAAINAGISLGSERQRGQFWTGMAKRLRVAAVLAGLALSIHAVGLLSEWRALANQQQALVQRMEQRFRSVFPDAVAVVDPALQMQRKLAEARHAAGHADSSDFLPMLEPVALALSDLPDGSLRQLSFSHGELTLTLSTLPTEQLQALLAKLRQSGLQIEAAEVADGQDLVVTVRTT